MQEFDEDSIQTKIIRSLLIIISTILPTFLLFDGFLRSFDWITLLICLGTCLLNAYLVRSINQHQTAAYLPSFLLLTVCYLTIGVRCTGTESTLIAGVNACVAFLCAATMLWVLITCWVAPHEGSDSASPLTPVEVLGIVLLALLALTKKSSAC
jgi:hypothetical protein